MKITLRGSSDWHNNVDLVLTDEELDVDTLIELYFSHDGEMVDVTVSKDELIRAVLAFKGRDISENYTEVKSPEHLKELLQVEAGQTSKCCKAETKLGGMPDFIGDDHISTVYNPPGVISCVM